MSERQITDPVERVIADALTVAGITFVHDSEAYTSNLDFYLPGYDIHIECKRYYTERVTEQLSRVKRVILIQSMEAAEVFAHLIAPQ